MDIFNQNKKITKDFALINGSIINPSNNKIEKGNLLIKNKFIEDFGSHINNENIACDKKLLKKAYYFSINRHNKQFRDSGEPFASHPYAVANILIKLKMISQNQSKLIL